MKICLTGGIACGKSLLSHYLNELGIRTLDADDVVHTLIPPEERKRLAAIVFNDPAQRKALEARIHPRVRRELEAFLATPGDLRLVVIPLLFEVQWDADYDIILCVAADRAKQIERMVTTRGYTPEEAAARLAAQMDVAEKAKKSHYVIWNNGSPEELKDAARACAAWLKKEVEHERHT